jgi:hypothetical protein
MLTGRMADIMVVAMTATMVMVVVTAIMVVLMIRLAGEGRSLYRVTGAWTSVSTDVSRLTLVTFMPNILGGNCVNA